MLYTKFKQSISQIIYITCFYTINKILVGYIHIVFHDLEGVHVRTCSVPVLSKELRLKHIYILQSHNQHFEKNKVQLKQKKLVYMSLK